MLLKSVLKLVTAAHAWSWVVVIIFYGTLQESTGPWMALALPVMGTAVAFFCGLVNARRLVFAIALGMSIFVVLTIYSIGFFNIPTAILLLLASYRMPHHSIQGTPHFLISGFALVYLGTMCAYLGWLTAKIVRLYLES